MQLRSHDEKNNDFCRRNNLLYQTASFSFFGIGGKKEWCITNVTPEIKADIQSIIVKGFEGIDHVVPDLNL